jgi:hypothetical protein
VELAKAAKELEDAMEADLDQMGDADATPRVQHDRFGESEGDDDVDEEAEAELDEMSEDPREKEWVASHKDLKNAEVHLATARDNLMVAVYMHGYAPGEVVDWQLAECQKKLQEAMACCFGTMNFKTVVLITIQVLAQDI